MHWYGVTSIQYLVWAHGAQTQLLTLAVTRRRWCLFVCFSKIDISLAGKEPQEGFSSHDGDILLGFLLLHLACFGAWRHCFAGSGSYSVRLAQSVSVQCALTFSGDLTNMAIVGLPHLAPPQIPYSSWYVLCLLFITYPAPLYIW